MYILSLPYTHSLSLFLSLSLSFLYPSPFLSPIHPETLAHMCASTHTHTHTHMHTHTLSHCLSFKCTHLLSLSLSLSFLLTDAQAKYRNNWWIKKKEGRGHKNVPPSPQPFLSFIPPEKFWKGNRPCNPAREPHKRFVLRKLEKSHVRTYRYQQFWL